MKIFDAHCHIYPGKIARRAADSISDFYDIPVEHDGTVRHLIEDGMKAGITNYLVHSVSTTPAQVNSINEFIAGQVKLHPDIMTGFGTLHPDSENIDADFAHLQELGLKGVKLHPDFQKFALDSEEAYRLCKAFAGKVPLLVHGGDFRYSFSNPNQLLKLMRRLPDLTVIGAHFGGWSCWEEAGEVLAGTPNLFVDCSSSLYALSPEKAAALIRRFGANRVIFGTDYPMWSADEEIKRFNAIDLTSDERTQILWSNAATLLGVED